MWVLFPTAVSLLVQVYTGLEVTSDSMVINTRANCASELT
uniref:Uncharacterized protein n=1 Tax=Anguilla anguilla TaxID=7936 RepID=A0A0E9WL88_ANGAN